MAELMFSLGQTKGNKKTKAKVKKTIDSLKDVKITETVESGIRKDQHEREIKYKETGREQKKKNMDVKSTYWYMKVSSLGRVIFSSIRGGTVRSLAFSLQLF